MSWEISLQAFEGVELATADGRAEVYGFEGEQTEGSTITGLEGEAVWQVVFDLMERGRMVAMPLDSSVCVTSPEEIADLPEELRHDVGVVVVRSAAELAAAALGDEPGR